jgi:hypothetical protein
MTALTYLQQLLNEEGLSLQISTLNERHTGMCVPLPDHPEICSVGCVVNSVGDLDAGARFLGRNLELLLESPDLYDQHGDLPGALVAAQCDKCGNPIVFVDERSEDTGPMRCPPCGASEARVWHLSIALRISLLRRALTEIAAGAQDNVTVALEPIMRDICKLEMDLSPEGPAAPISTNRP